MKLFRHIRFLKTVFLYSLTAFGGPQGHLGMMLKIFVHKYRYITEAELVDFNSFCQLLPGPGSTQTITLIGYKRGGVLLAIITLIIWILPACTIMGAFSFLITLSPTSNFSENLFKYLEPMAIGFLLYAIVRMYGMSVNNTITKCIMVLATLFTLYFFKSPWVFPVLIILAGVVSSFSKKRITEETVVKPRQIKWTNIWLFVILFLIAGFMSEYARKNQLGNRKAYNLFENFYRFGSIVFGGGDVLLPMLLDQYVERPYKQASDAEYRISVNRDDLLTGYGMVRAIPGPVFSIATYTGGIAMKGKGIGNQLLGCFLATLAIFLPSALLVLFFFPVWQYLKKFVVVFRALEGINAAVVGVMLAAAIYLLKVNFVAHQYNYFIIAGLVITGTFMLLRFSKLPPPFIVLMCILLGWVF